MGVVQTGLLRTETGDDLLADLRICFEQPTK